MNPSYLEFEQPIADLQAKIEELTSATDESMAGIAGSTTSEPAVHDGLHQLDFYRV